MRVVIVGGGPGGLYLSILLRRRREDCHVTVLERNPAHAAYGFGVVFSERTMEGLQEADPPTFKALADRAPHWDEIEVHHRGQTVRTRGHRFWAVARSSLLHVLQVEAARLGVEMAFERDVRDPSSYLADCDVLVAADGAHSTVRDRFRDEFGPELLFGRSNYIWLGSTNRFGSFTFIFATEGAANFGAHAYPIADGVSTFVVDASDGALRAAGLPANASDLAPGESDAATLAVLNDVFKPYLDGGQLIGNNSKWAKFREVRNERWSHENIVLLGDAAHTAHPNVGSGTKMAFEDAVVLADELTTSSDQAAALKRYEERRRPAVETIQAAARSASDWWDHFDGHLYRAPIQLTYHFLTRTGRIGHEGLRRRDPVMCDAIERWWSVDVAEANTRGQDPLDTPVTIGALQAPTRRILTVRPGESAAADVPPAGLDRVGVVRFLLDAETAASPIELPTPQRAASTRTENSPLHEICFERRSDTGRTVDSTAIAAVADAHRADLVGVRVTVEELCSGDVAPLQDLLENLSRDGARRGIGLVVGVEEPLAIEPRRWSQLCDELASWGATYLTVAGPNGSPPQARAEAWQRLLLLTDLARGNRRMITALDDPSMTPDEARQAVLSGRIDMAAVSAGT